MKSIDYIVTLFYIAGFFLALIIYFSRVTEGGVWVLLEFDGEEDE